MKKIWFGFRCPKGVSIFRTQRQWHAPLLLLGLSACGPVPQATLPKPPSLPPILRLSFQDASEKAAASGSLSSLAEIVRVGERASDWLRILQAKTPARARIQAWSRAEARVFTPTEFRPLLYSEELIIARYTEAMGQLGPIVLAVLSKNDELPTALPKDVSLFEVAVTARLLGPSYEQASRYLSLIDLKSELKKRPDLEANTFSVTQNKIIRGGARGISLAVKNSRTWVSRVVEDAWSTSHFTTTIHDLLSDASPTLEAVPSLNIFWSFSELSHALDVGSAELVLNQALEDGNELSEATVQHEFGHVLGFDDCYQEYWDEKQNAFVFYTLDPHNRMCAAEGDTLSGHIKALTHAYGEKPKP